MNSLDLIRSKILKLYKTNPNIHINAAITNSKAILKNEPVVIKGVYPHIFQIEERSDGSPKTHTLQYSDVLINHIEIYLSIYKSSSIKYAHIHHSFPIATLCYILLLDFLALAFSLMGEQD